MRDFEKDIGHGARFVERLNRRRGQTHGLDRRTRLRYSINPGLKRGVVGEDQVSQRARIIHDAVEAGDKWHLFKRGSNLRLSGHSKDWIGSIEKQGLGCVRLVEENLLDEGFDRGEAAR